MSDTVISVKNVSKDFHLPSEKFSSLKSRAVHPFKKVHYKTQHALKDINLDIKEGEFFGIVGRNGSGKSTLLKMLAGIYQPTKGSIEVKGKLVPFIELGVGFNPELTGRENVFLNGALLGFSEKEVVVMYDDIVEFAELGEFMEQKLKNYSSGMQVRLAFSMAIRAKADILLIDEVLAVGDAAFQRKCYEYFRQLKKNRKTVVFVSHNMDAIRQFCDRAVMIDQNVLVASGTANNIATKYSKIFIDDSQKEVKGSKGNKWGDRKANYKMVKVEGYDYGSETIKISAEIIVNDTIDNVSIGFLLKNSAGQILLGSNSIRENSNIKTLAKDKRYVIEWRVAQILNDGRYYIDLAISYDNGTMAEWWQDAATFTVELPEPSPFLIKPKTELSLHEK